MNVYCTYVNTFGPVDCFGLPITQNTAAPAPAHMNKGIEHTATAPYCCASVTSFPSKVNFLSVWRLAKWYPNPKLTATAINSNGEVKLEHSE